MSISHLCSQSGVRRAGAPRFLLVDDYRGAAIATATYLSLDGMEPVWLVMPRRLESSQILVAGCGSSGRPTELARTFARRVYLRSWCSDSAVSRSELLRVWEGVAP